MNRVVNYTAMIVVDGDGHETGDRIAWTMSVYTQRNPKGRLLSQGWITQRARNHQTPELCKERGITKPRNDCESRTAEPANPILSSYGDFYSGTCGKTVAYTTQ